jgi:hypothetical protein
MLAAMNNPNPEVIITLIKAGAKLDDRDTDGQDCLDVGSSLLFRIQKVITYTYQRRAQMEI